jgi:hypothetical protein
MAEQTNLQIISGVDKSRPPKLRGEAGRASIQNVIMGCGFFRAGLRYHSSVPDPCYGILQLRSLIITKGDHRLSCRGGLPELLYTTVPMVLDYGKRITKLLYLLSSPPRLDRPQEPLTTPSQEIPEAFATRLSGSWGKATTLSTSSQTTRQGPTKQGLRLPVYQI